jgi:hypothetical protein
VNVNSTADTIVGGLIGYDEFNGIIENCYSKANITVDAAGAYVGGLFGLSSTGLIESCFSKGNVRATTSSNSVYAGGLAGEGLEITIKNCFATGNVDAVSFSAYAFAGGMAGCIGNENNTLSYCYSTGQVSATTVSFNAHAGGLIGYVSKGNRMVSYNFTIGSVSAISSSALTYAGRIMGYPADMTNNFSFKNNYYCHDQQINRQEGSATFGNSSNQVGYSCTFEQLNTSTFYFTNLGWNSDIWDFGSLNFENGKYPLLKN